MSDLPTLVMDAGAFPNLTVHIDGPLPTVWNIGTPYAPGPPHGRPLRVGDRVELATECPCMKHGGPFKGGPCDGTGTVPFATATVTSIIGWLVTVSDVEEYND